MVLKNNVLYLDTEDNRRFEVSKVATKLADIFEDYNYRVAEVLRPWELGVEGMAAEGVPLAGERVRELVKEADWRDLCWGELGLRVKEPSKEISKETTSKDADIVVIEQIVSYKFFPYQPGVINIE